MHSHRTRCSSRRCIAWCSKVQYHNIWLHTKCQWVMVYSTMDILKPHIILMLHMEDTIISSPTDTPVMVTNTVIRCKIMEITINNISKLQQLWESTWSSQSRTSLKQTLPLHSSQDLLHHGAPPRLHIPPKTIISNYSKSIWGSSSNKWLSSNNKRCINNINSSRYQ